LPAHAPERNLGALRDGLHDHVARRLRDFVVRKLRDFVVRELRFLHWPFAPGSFLLAGLRELALRVLRGRLYD
jgi:hypothetical protein